MNKYVLPQGFSSAGVNAGIKKSGKNDMGLIFSEKPCTACAVFTKNKLVCAHILDAKKKINGKISAVLVNSGNANAFTGKQGIFDLGTLASGVSKLLNIKKNDVIFASTGMIGKQLPVNKMKKGIKTLHAVLSSKDKKFPLSIMTTDTKQKFKTVVKNIGGKKVTFSIVAKGSGMMAPNMATMLVFLMTDISINRKVFDSAMRESVDVTFNRITIDGDMSPNDTVYCLANGMAGNVPVNTKGKEYKKVVDVLKDLFYSMSVAMVEDGEGATKSIKIDVKNAKNKDDAKTAALTVANSLLVKTAFFGEALYMGRVVSAVGASGVNVDISKLVIKLNGKTVVSGGKELTGKTLLAEMKKKSINVSIDLKAGKAEYFVLTTDLSYDYIRINADYS